MWPPLEKRVTQDTRAKTCNLVLGLLLSPISLTTIIKLLLPSCGELSHRQPESGGSPISFVHFSPSFSAKPYPSPGVSASRASFAKAGLHWSNWDEKPWGGCQQPPQPRLCVSHIWAKQLVLSVHYTVLTLYPQNKENMWTLLMYVRSNANIFHSHKMLWKKSFR